MKSTRRASRSAAAHSHGLPGPCVRSDAIECRTMMPLAFAAALCTATGASHAFPIDVGVPDVDVRFDNTIKYSGAARLRNPSGTLVDGFPNGDDGDRNFRRGVISNRLDLLSEFDVSYKGSGLRLSGAGWYDSVYNGHTDNDSPGTYNAVSVSNQAFPDATRKLHGRKAELLDAFVFTSQALGDMNATVRLGRHAVLYGESLFFGDNGIAGGQAPTDIVKLLSVPNTQFKELTRPVNQISTQLQVNANLLLGGYYQFEWEENRIPAAGSYFSRADLFDRGGERLVVGAPGGPFAAPPAFFRAPDIKGKNSGQYGLQLRYRSDALATDFGVYATRYHDKNFQVYVNPSAGAPNFTTGQIGTYQLVYAEGIRAYGVSASRSIGTVNLAGEISVRRNTPLVAAGGSVTVTPGTVADNNANPLYPVGNSLHAQVSILQTLERSPLWEGGSLLAEVAWNRRTSVTRNAEGLDPNASRDALALRALFTPSWFQVFQGIDLSMPIGIGYVPSGKSSVVTLFNGGWTHGGDISIGLSGEFQQVWKGGINFTHYFGSAGPVLDAANAYSFKQSLKDRDFISVTFQRSF